MPHAHTLHSATRGLFLIALLLSGLGCSAQNGLDHGDDLSSKTRQEALDLVYKECPGADILEIENNEDYIEIDFLCDGLYYEIGIVNGKVIYKEEEIKKSDIPYDKISKKIHKSYPGYVIDEFSRIITADTTFLHVEIVKEGIQRNIYFTEEGKKYSTEWNFTDSEWSENTLARYRELDFDYDLLSPTKIIEVPEILREISGIVAISDTKVLCVQDELGVVFEFDLNEEKITATHRFTDTGDFEDLAVKGDTVFVLRSDGGIFSFNFRDYRGNARMFLIPTQSLNLEGLYYDESKEEFLVASKENEHSGSSDLRPVYRFRSSAPHSVKTAWSIDTEEVEAALHEAFPEFSRTKVNFNPSAIAMRPGTDEIFVLSASDRVLAVYEKGKLKSVFPLSENGYYKPEGLDFLPNGDMLISSEGDKKGMAKQRIILFKKK